MANEEIKVLDPLGKTIYLPLGICDKEDTQQDIYDDVQTVIQKPAILIEVTENSENYFYYFRSIGWNQTLLITVHLRNSQWEAVHCQKNPSTRELSFILKKGKQII